MKIVSVMNYKGGVGKTTLTANLGAELAYRGMRILLMDMDAQCSLTFSFITPDQWQSAVGGGGESDDKTIKSWFDGIIDQDMEAPNLDDLVALDLRVNRSIINKGRLGLIPSHLGLINVDLDLAYMLSGVSPGRMERQRTRVYGQLRDHLRNYAMDAGYDLVLIDCPPNFNIVTKNAIVASDSILIPAKPDYLSTLGIDYLVRSLGTLVEEYNRGSPDISVRPEILGVVFTMIQVYGGRPIGAQRPYMREDGIPVPVFSSRIRENKTIFAGAPETLIPVVIQGYNQSTHSRIVREIEELANEFCERSGIQP